MIVRRFVVAFIREAWSLGLESLGLQLGLKNISELTFHIFLSFILSYLFHVRLDVVVIIDDFSFAHEHIVAALAGGR